MFAFLPVSTPEAAIDLLRVGLSRIRSETKDYETLLYKPAKLPHSTFWQGALGLYSKIALLVEMFSRKKSKPLLMET
tara:strand:- start:62 stop:292 length:231 start_codon:yes stop_codon:yes gene_type:complete